MRRRSAIRFTRARALGFSASAANLRLCVLFVVLCCVGLVMLGGGGRW